MAGLLDSLYANDGNNPMSMGLLGMGAGLLAGANGNYGAFGPALASGMMGAAQGMQNARDFEMQNAYRQAQIRKLDQDSQKQRQLLAALGGDFGDSGTMPQPGGAPGSSPARGPLLAGPIPGGSPGLLGGAPPYGSAPGGFPYTLSQVMKIRALGGPDLFDMYKYATDGVKRESGAAYRNPVTGAVEYGPPKLPEGMELVAGPNGPMIRQVQGYSDANAAAKAAEADAVAKAQGRYTTTTIPKGNGGSQMVLTSDLPTLLNGQGQPQVGTAPGNEPQGEGLGYTPPQAVMDARNQFGETKAMADQMLSNINSLRNHKGFDSNYGFVGMVPNRPGGDAADAKALTNQLVSQGWLQMRDKLKGSGAITDYESNKAEQAWSALNDPRISPEMARKQLDIIEQVLRDGLARAETKAFGAKSKDDRPAAAGGASSDFSGGNFSSLWGG